MANRRENEEKKAGEKAGGKDRESGKTPRPGGRRRLLIGAGLCILAVFGALLLYRHQGQQPEPGAQSSPETEEAAGTAGAEQAGSAATEPGGTGASAAAETEAAVAAASAATGSSSGRDKAVPRSPEMDALERELRGRLGEKNGDWSLYLYRFDTGEEIGIHANEPMISASLIKLFIAGCYLEQVKKGNLQDDYQNQLYSMLSASDNGAANTLIDVLGFEEINAFIRDHGWRAGKLNRKMLVQNGTENYTSARDCGEVLRAAYKGKYISREASERVLEAMGAQISRNRRKIPAGVPGEVETANKTGELFTNNAEGVYVDVQNDAAVIYAEDHPYVLVIMSAVPSAGEGELHAQIAELSSIIYEAVCGDQ